LELATLPLSSKKLHITVTAEDLEKGVKEDGCKCPLALAIKHKIQNYWRDVGVQVKLDQVLIYRKNKPDLILGVDLSEDMKRFVKSFDSGESQEPDLEFILDFDEVAILGGPSEARIESYEI
jgi:hypothetical protein